MKRNDFAFDQEFRGNLAGVSAQQTEGSSWTKPLLLVAAGVVGAVVGLTMDAVFGTNATQGAIFGAIGGQIVQNWFDTDRADEGASPPSSSAAQVHGLPILKR